jgi:hypothetical protein
VIKFIKFSVAEHFTVRFISGTSSATITKLAAASCATLIGLSFDTKLRESNTELCQIPGKIDVTNDENTFAIFRIRNPTNDLFFLGVSSQLRASFAILPHGATQTESCCAKRLTCGPKNNGKRSYFRNGRKR